MIGVRNICCNALPSVIILPRSYSERAACVIWTRPDTTSALVVVLCARFGRTRPLFRQVPVDNLHCVNNTGVCELLHITAQ